MSLASGNIKSTSPKEVIPGSLRSVMTLAIVSLFTLAVLWFAGKGSLLRVTYPALCTLIALFLLLRRPTAYLRFTLWVWFLSPFVRRIVDWRCGWADPNLILVAPLLVSAVSLITLLRTRSEAPLTRTPFILCMCGVLYGLVVGLFLHPSMETVYGLFNWASPVLLGLHVSTHWKEYKEHRTAILSTFCWGTLLLGIYGIYQYFVAPDWDIYWLQNVTSGLIDPSFGKPEPMGMRVWSTMNSAGPFANMLLAGLLLLSLSKQRGKWIFTSAGFFALLLTVVRTTWLSWALAVVLQLKGVQPKVILKSSLSLLLLAACLIPLSKNSYTGPLLEQRFQSFKNLGKDESFNERANMYRTLFEKAQQDPFGHGLRNQEVIGNIVVDSGILTTLFSLGWAGALLYLSGAISLVLRHARAARDDSFAWTCKVICVAFLSQIIGMNIFVGSTGTFFWVLAGMAMSAEQWHRKNMEADTTQPIMAHG